MEEYKNIIFDLGGVILNLEYQKTQRAFESLGLADFKTLYSQAQQTGLFDLYEQGLCSTPYFINSLLPFLPTGTTANKVVQAWNAMILDFPIEKLNGVLALKETHRTFLLSNTNDLHIQAVYRALKAVYPASDLNPFFEKVYFSSDLQMRKPSKSIFEYVCRENKLNPAETLFIDDTEQHIVGAKSTGLNTLLVPTNVPWETIYLGITQPKFHP